MTGEYAKCFKAVHTKRKVTKERVKIKYFCEYWSKFFYRFPSAMLKFLSSGCGNNWLLLTQMPMRNKPPILHVWVFVKWTFRTMHMDDWSGHRLIHLRKETLYLSLFNQLKQTQNNSIIYICSIFINEPSHGLFSSSLFECIISHKQKGKDSDPPQAVVQTSFLSGVNMHKSTRATDFRSKVGNKNNQGLLFICSPRRERTPCGVLEGCADEVSAAHIYLRSAIAPAVWTPVTPDLTGEGSSKRHR